MPADAEAVSEPLERDPVLPGGCHRVAQLDAGVVEPLLRLAVSLNGSVEVAHCAHTAPVRCTDVSAFVPDRSVDIPSERALNQRMRSGCRTDALLRIRFSGRRTVRLAPLHGTAGRLCVEGGT